MKSNKGSSREIKTRRKKRQEWHRIGTHTLTLHLPYNAPGSRTHRSPNLNLKPNPKANPIGLRTAHARSGSTKVNFLILP
eukprot:153298-Amorphochlora_amoeboformis.AAC.1